MLVARYKKNADGNLRIENRRILIRLDQKNNPLFEKGVFLTLNDFKNSTDAKEYLSLTYAPTNKFFYDIPQCSSCGILYNNLGEPFSDTLGKRDDDRTYLTRTWPAFGHDGGGFEIILSYVARGETQSIKECKCEQIFDTSMKDPFINDIYHQDYITELDESIMAKLASTLVSGVNETDGFTLVLREDREGLRPIGKLENDNGVSIRFYGRKTKISYSLSAGYYCDTRKKTINFMFWGYGWEDENFERSLHGPVVNSYVWNSEASEPNNCENLKKLFIERVDSQGAPEMGDIGLSVSYILKYLGQLDGLCSDRSLHYRQWESHDRLFNKKVSLYEVNNSRLP